MTDRLFWKAVALSASRGRIRLRQRLLLQPLLPSFLPLFAVTLSFVTGSRALTEKPAKNEDLDVRAHF